MDLRGYANAATSAVNPNIMVTVERSNGYTMDGGGRQVPAYASAVVGPANVQALDGDDLKHLDGINVQGTIRAIYLRGSLAGVVRPNSKGGDKITIGSEVWLVVKVIESWPTWTKAAIVYQGVA